MTSTPLERVASARRRMEAARVALRDAIVAAEEAGETQRNIAGAAELSQGEVWRILRRGKLPS